MEVARLLCCAVKTTMKSKFSAAANDWVASGCLQLCSYATRNLVVAVVAVSFISAPSTQFKGYDKSKEI